MRGQTARQSQLIDSWEVNHHCCNRKLQSDCSQHTAWGSLAPAARAELVMDISSSVSRSVLRLIEHEALCIAWSDLQDTATAESRRHIAGVHPAATTSPSCSISLVNEHDIRGKYHCGEGRHSNVHSMQPRWASSADLTMLPQRSSVADRRVAIWRQA